MTKVIELTDLHIRRLVIDYDRQVVIAIYEMRDASGQDWISGEGTFFVTMPPQTPIYDVQGNVTGYEPYPPNWFQLPESYFPTLLGLLNDADVALTSTMLV